jgi:predicted secreted protein
MFFSDTGKEEISMAKKNICVTAILALAASLWAGDTASFVDLGFSSDGRTYMFAQYGVQSGTLKPWADLFVVDVPRNNFVAGGKISYFHDTPVVAGQDGSGALYRIISRNASIADQYRIDFCRQGQPLYVSLENDNGSRGETIEFRDFESGDFYRASLVPFTEGSGSTLQSSFYIDLEKVSGNGSRRTYTMGAPRLKRPLVVSYRIRKVMTAPRDGSSIIFVIEMKKQAAPGSDVDIRYMVETAKLP